MGGDGLGDTEATGGPDKANGLPPPTTAALRVTGPDKANGLLSATDGAGVAVKGEETMTAAAVGDAKNGLKVLPRRAGASPPPGAGGRTKSAS